MEIRESLDRIRNIDQTKKSAEQRFVEATYGLTHWIYAGSFFMAVVFLVLMVSTQLGR
jgi:hypothetical protein